ncbi:MAG: hypothetical protein HXY51_09495 [Nitrospirae bacterium]|nr:hypothetical protein [Nitrospirota bacterium]
MTDVARRSKPSPAWGPHVRATKAYLLSVRVVHETVRSGMKIGRYTDIHE